MENFTFIGKLDRVKETEKNKNFEKKESNKGWVSQTCKFRVIVDKQSFFVKAYGGVSKKERTCSVLMEKKDGKGFVRSTIPFKKRKNSQVMENVPIWARYMLKLDDKNTYYSCSGWDLAEMINKMLESGEYKNRLFKVTGDINRSTNDGKCYSSYDVKQVTLLDENEDVTCSAKSSVDIFFDKEGLPEIDLKADEVIVDGFVSCYDSESKETKYMEYPLTINHEDGINGDRKFEHIQKKFFHVDDTKVYKVRSLVEIFDGNEKVEISLDDLDEETRYSVEVGLITLDDAAKELSEDGNVYGDRVHKNIFIKPGKGNARGKVLADDVTSDDLHDRGAGDVNFDSGNDIDFDIDDDDDLVSIESDDDGYSISEDDLPF